MSINSLPYYVPVFLCLCLVFLTTLSTSEDWTMLYTSLPLLVTHCTIIYHCWQVALKSESQFKSFSVFFCSFLFLLTAWKSCYCDYPGWSIIIELMWRVFWNLMWFEKVSVKSRLIILNCVCVHAYACMLWLLSKSFNRHFGGIEGATINYLFKGRIGRKTLLCSVVENSIFL